MRFDLRVFFDFLEPRVCLRPPVEVYPGVSGAVPNNDDAPWVVVTEGATD